MVQLFCASKGANDAVFRSFYAVKLNALFLLLLCVYGAVFGASKGANDAVFRSFYAVNEWTFPPSFMFLWCSF
jgi:hypothetical protein